MCCAAGPNLRHSCSLSPIAASVQCLHALVHPLRRLSLLVQQLLCRCAPLHRSSDARSTPRWSLRRLPRLAQYLPRRRAARQADVDDEPKHHHHGEHRTNADAARCMLCEGVCRAHTRPALAHGKPCNNTGFTDPNDTKGWGIVDFDWSNSKGTGTADGWAKHKPMDDEELLFKQVQMTATATKGSTVWYV